MELNAGHHFEAMSATLIRPFSKVGSDSLAMGSIDDDEAKHLRGIKIGELGQMQSTPGGNVFAPRQLRSMEEQVEALMIRRTLIEEQRRKFEGFQGG